MPATGTFGGFPFDPEVYQGFVDQEATFSDSIYASGILANDQSLTDAMSAQGGVMGTLRFYNPLDPAEDAPLVRDGVNDNVPTEISGGKQTWIRVDRMKAWKATDLTRELNALSMTLDDIYAGKIYMADAALVANLGQHIKAEATAVWGADGVVVRTPDLPQTGSAPVYIGYIMILAALALGVRVWAKR